MMCFGCDAVFFCRVEVKAVVWYWRVMFKWNQVHIQICCSPVCTMLTSWVLSSDGQ